MTRPDSASARLVLDDMFSPQIATTLRTRSHDVVAVAERDDLRSMTDDGLFAWASAASGWSAAEPAVKRAAEGTAEGRWLLTENVKDFRPILLRALQAGGATGGLLFTSSRTFPRSRKDPGPLIEALHAWLTSGPPAPPITEDWLALVDPR